MSKNHKTKRNNMIKIERYSILVLSLIMSTSYSMKKEKKQKAPLFNAYKTIALNNKRPFSSIAFDTNGQKIAAGTKEEVTYEQDRPTIFPGFVAVYDITSEKELYRIKPQTDGHVIALKFVKYGNHEKLLIAITSTTPLLLLAEDQNLPTYTVVEHWNVLSQSLQYNRTLPLSTNRCISASFSPSGAYISTLNALNNEKNRNAGNQVVIFNTHDGTLLKQVELKKLQTLCYFFDEPSEIRCYDDVNTTCYNKKSDVAVYANNKKIWFEKKGHIFQTINTPSTEVKEGKRVVNIIWNNAGAITLSPDDNFCAYTINFNSNIIILKKEPLNQEKK